MNPQELVNLTNHIIQRYYMNDTQPFLDHVDEKVLWYGPAKGQFISGRKAVFEAWANEKHSLRFTVGNIRLDYITSHPSYCEVMASFPVTTHFPDGQNIAVNQIIHTTWCERKLEGLPGKQPRMLVVHISNLYYNHESDNIYPVHFNEVYKGYVPISEVGQQLHFQGLDTSDLYIMSDSILWVDSISNGRHSVLHTRDEEYRIKDSVAELEKQYPDLLVRCHRCHLINPKHIDNIRRFTAVLDNGKELPIPEKKYTAFKKAVQELLNSINPSQEQESL